MSRSPRPQGVRAPRARRVGERRPPPPDLLVWAAALAPAACGPADTPASSPDAGQAASAPGVPAPGTTEPTGAHPARAPRGPRGDPGDPHASAAAESEAGSWFVERTEDWGVDFVHAAGALPEKHLPETMGAGAALFDCDGDGDLDLYLVQGGPMRLGDGPGRFREPPSSGGAPLPPNRLYLNRGDGRMTDATAESGAAAHTGYGMGVVAGDFDGDGHTDLFVTNLGADALLLGDGAGRFRDGSSAAGVDDPRWTAGAVAFDAEGDGDLDLYVTAYLEVDLSEPLWCGDRRPGWRSVCHPDAYPGLADRFYLNHGDGSFADRTAEAGLADNLGKGLGVVAFDANGDGHLDLYVANDSVENRLWLGDGEGRFEDGTLLSGTGVNGRGATEAGMGLAVGDVDGDLREDLFVTNFDNESNTLYRNLGDGRFGDWTAPAGLEAASRLPVGFGTALVDLDHDADLDLVVANGHIIDNIHLYHDGKTHAQPVQAFENDGAGRFRELGPDELGPLAAARVGRGLYPGDLDGDGDLDLVLTECGGPARLFENVRARTPGLLLDGLPDGARVRIRLRDGRELARRALAPVSYFGQGGREVHLGAGPEVIEWLELGAPGGGRRIAGADLVPGARRVVHLAP